MIHLTTSEIVSIVIAMASVTVALVSMLSYVRKREITFAHYDELKHRAMLDETRKHFETQLYVLTERLMSAENRWRDVNHLVISGQNASATLTENPNEETKELPFLSRMGIKREEYQIDRNLVFVLIPFHPEFDPVYQSIKEVCSSVGLICVRGDEQHVTGDLLSHILRTLVRARLVIAVLDGRNPNVFYELGIAHSLDKPVIALARSVTDIPFDIRSKRLIIYQDLKGLRDVLLPELAKLFVANP